MAAPGASSSARPASSLAADLRLGGPDGVVMPRLLYGTAWKKQRSAELVYQAIKSGFRGVDTAAQPRHYNEGLVGEGIRRAISEGIVGRKDLFIQTKFSPPSAQDAETAPYTLDRPIAEQVNESTESSLRHLSTPDVAEAYIDCVMLHSPYERPADTRAAWAALHEHVARGRVRAVGISHAEPRHLASTTDGGDGDDDDVVLKPPPSVVQNRFHGQTAYAGAVRQICRRKGILFQSFWTLTGNTHERRGAWAGCIDKVAVGAGTSREAAVYALVLGLGGTAVLDGTTSRDHMIQDVAAIERAGSWAEGQGKAAWDEALAEFKQLTGDGPG